VAKARKLSATGKEESYASSLYWGAYAENFNMPEIVHLPSTDDGDVIEYHEFCADGIRFRRKVRRRAGDQAVASVIVRTQEVCELGDDARAAEFQNTTNLPPTGETQDEGVDRDLPKAAFPVTPTEPVEVRCFRPSRLPDQSLDLQLVDLCRQAVAHVLSETTRAPIFEEVANSFIQSATELASEGRLVAKRMRPRFQNQSMRREINAILAVQHQFKTELASWDRQMKTSREYLQSLVKRRSEPVVLDMENIDESSCFAADFERTLDTVVLYSDQIRTSLFLADEERRASQSKLGEAAKHLSIKAFGGNSLFQDKHPRMLIEAIASANAKNESEKQ